MTKFSGIVLTGDHAGEYHIGPDGENRLRLPQQLPVMEIYPGAFEFQPSPEIVHGSLIEYRHVQFEWHNPHSVPERVKMGYWVPLNDETRKYRDDAEFRMWVLNHLTTRYTETAKAVDNSHPRG